MYCREEAIRIAKEEIRMGRMTTDQANVYMVQLEGVHIVSGRIARDVRRALNEAVKNGELGHIGKDGFKPEVYHHKNARANAIEARNRVAAEAKKALSGIFA